MSEGSRDRGFSPNIGRRLLAGAGAAFAVTLFALVFVQPQEETSAQADPYSVSALGHAALVEWLDAQAPTLVSRSYSVERASPERPLLILEPPPGSEQALAGMLEQALEQWIPTVLVLPKWQGTPRAKRPEWVETVKLWPQGVPETVLDTALGAVDAVTGDGADPDETSSERLRVWRGDGRASGEPERSPERWTWNLPGEPVAPALPEPQLLEIEGAPLDPLLATADGRVLAARFREVPLTLVSDPDFLNAGGLARGDNARVAHGLLLRELAPEALVVDASLHGYVPTESIWRALLEPPLVYLFLQGLLLAALGAWVGSGRLGRPESLPPRVPPGKTTLIDHGARILARGRHRKHTLERYLRLTVQRTAQRLGARPQDGLRGQVTALAELGRRRDIETDVEDLARRVARLPSRGTGRSRELEIAHALWTWRKEMTDGDS